MGGGGGKSFTGFSPQHQCHHLIIGVISLVLTGCETQVLGDDPSVGAG
jgi:hypothetical protein